MHSLILFQRDKGLSLIEVLVVVVILGITSAFAVPSFSAWIEKYRVKKAARQLATDLQFAKMKSIAEKVEYKIVFDSANKAYTIQRGDLPAASTSWTTVSIARQLADSTNPYYSKSVSLHCTDSTVTVTPTGSSSMATIKLSTGSCADGTTDCQARSCEKCVRTILSGRVRVE